MIKREIDTPGHPDYGKYRYILDDVEFKELIVILEKLIFSTEYNCNSSINDDVWDEGLKEGKEYLSKLKEL